jgi:hypothetical protein
VKKNLEDLPALAFFFPGNHFDHVIFAYMKPD